MRSRPTLLVLAPRLLVVLERSVRVLAVDRVVWLVARVSLLHWDLRPQ